MGGSDSRIHNQPVKVITNTEGTGVVQADGFFRLWYQYFLQQRGLAEAMIPGNEEVWIRHFFGRAGRERKVSDFALENSRQGRVIENQMLMVGPNQVGSEEFGADGVATYFGDSVIIDPWGGTVIEACETGEMLLTATIDTEQAAEVRKKMKVLCDRRPALYELG
jgi:hypothetical protein